MSIGAITPAAPVEPEHTATNGTHAPPVRKAAPSRPPADDEEQPRESQSEAVGVIDRIV